MKRSNYRGLFAEWEIKILVNVVRRFSSQWKCLNAEEDDLAQECAMEWCKVKRDHDPSTGEINGGLMKRVLENHLQSLVNKLTAKKRVATLFSLDEPVSDSEGSATYVDRIPADKDYAHKLRVSIGRAQHIAEVVERLSHRQQALCSLIKEKRPIKEICRELKVHRATYYNELERIKLIFEGDGLQDYF